MSHLMLSRKRVVAETGITRGQLDAAVEKGLVITAPDGTRNKLYSVADCQAVVAHAVARAKDISAKRVRKARRSELNEAPPDEGYLTVDQTRDLLGVKGRQYVTALAARYAWAKKKWGSSSHRVAYLESDVIITKKIMADRKARGLGPRVDPNQITLDDYLGVTE